MESFDWVSETFLAAMGNKQPITILIDQCRQMELQLQKPCLM